MSHQIEVSDIVGGIKVIDLAGSFGKKDDKRFQVEVTIATDGGIYGEYVVLDHQVPVYRGANVDDAVEVYNKL